MPRYTFCIPLIRVPPTSVDESPVVSYQNGAGAVVNCESSKLRSRHELIGLEASLVPGRQRQLRAAVGTRTAAWSEKQESKTQAKVTNDSLIIGVYRLSSHNVTNKRKRNGKTDFHTISTDGCPCPRDEHPPVGRANPSRQGFNFRSPAACRIS